MNLNSLEMRAMRIAYALSGDELHLVKSYMDFRVLVESNLKFHRHIFSDVDKASFMANQLLRSTVNRSCGLMVSLFISHIRPILDFCYTV